MTSSYPLHWPASWKRIPANQRKRANFGKQAIQKYSHSDATYKTRVSLTIADAIKRLFGEMERLGASNLIVSSNVETRLDGTPRSDRKTPDDAGVAVYFQLNSKARVLACDKWDRVADNIAAIAGHVEAIRAQERYGVGTLDQAFTGYTALPAPKSATRHWSEVLGVTKNAQFHEIDFAYKAKAMKIHSAGGNHDLMVELNLAREAAERGDE